MHICMDNDNNKIRLQLKERYVDDEYNINTDLIIKDMNYLKEHSFNKYVKLISLLYPVFFIMNEEAACDYADKMLDGIDAQMDDMDDDYGEVSDDLDDIDVSELFDDEECHPEFYSLDDVDNIYDFIDWMKIDSQILIDLFRYNFEFIDEGYFDIRELLNNYKDCDPYLMDISPLWFIDKYFYCHEITLDEINYKYFSGMKNNIDRVFLIDSVVNYLSVFGIHDSENYKKVIVDIINYSYRYQKYLLMSNNYDSFKDTIEQSVSYIENKSVEDINLCNIDGEHLYTILDYYFDFIESFDNNEKIINDFCDKNKCKIKSIKLI